MPAAATKVEPRAQPPAALWGLGAVLAVVLGVGVVEAPAAVAVVLGLTAASALVAGAFAEPRWALVATLAVLFSYTGWVVGQRAGAVDVTPVFLALVLAGALWRRVHDGRPLEVPREVAALVVLALVWGLSAVFAADPAASAVRLADFVGWTLLIAAMAALLATTEWFRRALWAIVLAAAGLAALAVIQHATGAYGSDFGGLAGIQGDPSSALPRSEGPLQANNFAQMLLVAAVLASYLALAARSRRERLLAIAAGTACGVALVLTGSRGGVFAAGIVFVLVVALRPVPRRLLLAVAAVAALVTVPLLPPTYTERFTVVTTLDSGVATSRDGAVRGRASENLAALQMWADHPLLGVGLANYPVRYLEYSEEIGIDPRNEERAAHSLFLEAFAESGLLGTPVFLAVLGFALRGPWRARRALPRRDALLAEGTFVAVVGFLAAGLFLHAAYPRYLWVVVGLGLTAGRLVPRA